MGVPRADISDDDDPVSGVLPLMSCASLNLKPATFEQHSQEASLAQTSPYIQKKSDAWDVTRSQPRGHTLNLWDTLTEMPSGQRLPT